MGIVNRRNAVAGWVFIKLGKQVVKEAVPSKRTGGAAAGALAATAALLAVRRSRRGSSTE
jgi:hypothetical protein